jgi:hypothetical protein
MHATTRCLADVQELFDARVAASAPPAPTAPPPNQQPPGPVLSPAPTNAQATPPIHCPASAASLVNIQLASASFRFSRSDYGHLISFSDDMGDESTPHCSLALCLGAALDIPPTSIANHFQCRASQIRTAERLLLDHTENAEQWQAFLEQLRKPSYSNLAFSFPTPEGSSDTAAAYELGAPMHPHNLTLLAPTEARQRHLVFFQGLRADAHGDVSLTISNKQLASHIECIPPSFLGHGGAQPDGIPLPPLFFANIDGHYSLLTCLSDPFPLLELIMRKLQRDRVFLYIPPRERDDLVTPFVKLVGLCAPCSSPQDLSDAHEACMAVIQQLHHQAAAPDTSDVLLLDHATRSGSPAPDPAPESEPVDLLLPHDAPATPPRSSPSKKQDLRRTPDRQGSSQASASPASLSPSTTSQVDRMSLSSIDSMTDMGGYVAKQGRRGESKYQPLIYVKGAASSDETSEDGSMQPSSQSATTSCTPSVFSTGTHHPHAIPPSSRYYNDLPPCPKCRHSLQFGQYHDGNHACDCAHCTSPVIPEKGWGWHCPQCSVDYCVEPSCIPIDWEPISSYPSTLDSAASSQTLQLSSQPSPSAAPRHQDGADAAASGRGRDV